MKFPIFVSFASFVLAGIVTKKANEKSNVNKSTSQAYKKPGVAVPRAADCSTDKVKGNYGKEQSTNYPVDKVKYDVYDKKKDENHKEKKDENHKEKKDKKDKKKDKKKDEVEYYSRTNIISTTSIYQSTRSCSARSCSSVSTSVPVTSVTTHTSTNVHNTQSHTYFPTSVPVTSVITPTSTRINHSTSTPTPVPITSLLPNLGSPTPVSTPCLLTTPTPIHTPKPVPITELLPHLGTDDYHYTPTPTPTHSPAPYITVSPNEIDRVYNNYFPTKHPDPESDMLPVLSGSLGRSVSHCILGASFLFMIL